MTKGFIYVVQSLNVLSEMSQLYTLFIVVFIFFYDMHALKCKCKMNKPII